MLRRPPHNVPKHSKRQTLTLRRHIQYFILSEIKRHKKSLQYSGVNQTSPSLYTYISLTYVYMTDKSADAGNPQTQKGGVQRVLRVEHNAPKLGD